MNGPQVSVVGLGNTLLGDDALGVVVVQALERAYVIPSSVNVVDAGTSGLDLVGYLLDSEHLIFVDAMIADAPPGTVRTVQQAALLAAQPVGPRLSPHEPAISDVLTLLELAGRGPRDAVLVGIVPESTDVGVELSAAAAAAVPYALDEVVRHLGRFGVELARREPAVDGIHLDIEGIVQGVGMRPWLKRTSERLGLRGTVTNSAQGVAVDAHGPPGALDALVAAVRSDAPVLARVDAVRVERRTGPGPAGFTILPSVGAARQRPSIPADAATCDACRHEIEDPANRRHRHAFNGCTDCGPRYAVVTALPYERERTSMAAFPMCAACTREYTDPGDRRFHAQATCCPGCGPRLWLEAPLGREERAADPIAEAAARLTAGEIVAIQGIGGIHLACDATSEMAVARLRVRKRREERPFAVMTDRATAVTLAELDESALAALGSAAHPIVLAPRRSAALAAGVTHGSARLGLLLPYTPLHHLLLAAVGRPLVMTSGNRSGEPIAVTREDAQRALSEVADAFLFHDRAIVRRIEDSVVAAGSGRTHVLRRARGYAPRPVRLPLSAPEPVLALGGHQKSTACLVIGDEAYLTPHLGDLGSHEAERAYEAEVESFERLFGVRARVVVQDRHPGYASRRYALGRDGCARLGVQHHHAHVLATIAEQRIDGPVVAAAFDGMGYGLDGTAWGAEILAVDGLSWTRPFSLRPLGLAGGERAIREVWRGAWALVRDAFGEEADGIAASLALFAAIPEETRARVGRMLEEGVNVTQARGMGRYFDAFAALCTGRTSATFEGQLAVALEEAALGCARDPYPFVMPVVASTSLGSSAESELDLRPTTRAVVADLLAGTSRQTIASRFHATIIEGAAQLLERAAGRDSTIVLTGGCFQNALLDAGLRARLGHLTIADAGEVPVNDGGLALGQAWAGVLAVRAGQV
ncbi:MAG: (NiFe) hydrogenase maturation protein HypF [Labilithrix sp.]|nr:(NiFe) hydrogenase maturation protein HypF [Labilithrix sp.]